MKRYSLKLVLFCYDNGSWEERYYVMNENYDFECISTNDVIYLYEIGQSDPSDLDYEDNLAESYKMRSI